MATKTPKKKSIAETSAPAMDDRSMQALLQMAQTKSISFGNENSSENTRNQGIAEISNTKIGEGPEIVPENTHNQEVENPQTNQGEINSTKVGEQETNNNTKELAKAEREKVEVSSEINPSSIQNENFSSSSELEALEKPTASTLSDDPIPKTSNEEPEFEKKDRKITKASRKHSNTIPDIEEFTKKIFVKHESPYQTQMWISDSNYSKIKALFQMINFLELEGADGASARGVLNNIISQYFTENAEQFKKIEKAYMQKLKNSIF